MRVAIGALLISVLASPIAAAQSLMLPRIDSINFYGEVGDFEGKTAVDAQTYGPFGTYGWGFETAFTLAASDSHVVELAVGYDQLFQHARFSDGFTLSGEVRELPSISIYVSFPNDLYVGFATGVVSLANANINDAGAARFSITGDTFDAAAKIGYEIPLQPGTSIVDRRVYGFVESDYHARYFGGLNYGPGAPAELPSRMYLGGFTVSAGVQISLDGKNSAKARLAQAAAKSSPPAAKPIEAKSSKETPKPGDSKDSGVKN
jgi:hypothetical protein